MNIPIYLFTTSLLTYSRSIFLGFCLSFASQTLHCLDKLLFRMQLAHAAAIHCSPWHVILFASHPYGCIFFHSCIQTWLPRPSTGKLSVNPHQIFSDAVLHVLPDQSLEAGPGIFSRHSSLNNDLPLTFFDFSYLCQLYPCYTHTMEEHCQDTSCPYSMAQHQAKPLLL